MTFEYRNDPEEIVFVDSSERYDWNALYALLAKTAELIAVNLAAINELLAAIRRETSDDIPEID